MSRNIRKGICDGKCFECRFPDCILTEAEAAALEAKDRGINPNFGLKRSVKNDSPDDRLNEKRKRRRERDLANVKVNRNSGKQLRTMRHRLGMGQMDFAKAIGVSPTTVSRWENGYIPVNVETIAPVFPEIREVVR